MTPQWGFKSKIAPLYRREVNVRLTVVASVPLRFDLKNLSRTEKLPVNVTTFIKKKS